MIVDRISGDAPPDYFIGPTWCLDKPAVKAAVLAEFARRGTRQGAKYDPGRGPLRCRGS
jgi:radical SAM superfamily enzyme